MMMMMMMRPSDAEIKEMAQPPALTADVYVWKENNRKIEIGTAFYTID